MVEGCEELLDYVKRDKYFLSDASDMQASLSEFFRSFANVQELLEQWTSVLMKDLEAVEPVSEADDASVKAAAPPVVQSAFVVVNPDRQTPASADERTPSRFYQDLLEDSRP